MDSNEENVHIMSDGEYASNKMQTINLDQQMSLFAKEKAADDLVIHSSSEDNGSPHDQKYENSFRVAKQPGSAALQK